MKHWLKRSPLINDQFGDGTDLPNSKVCYFGGGGSSPAPSGQTTTVQKSDPWEGQQPYLNGSSGVFPTAQAFYTGGDTGFNSANAPQYYQGTNNPGDQNTVAPLNDIQNQAIGQTADLGFSGTPVSNQAMQTNTDFLSGQMMPQNNPYFGQMADSVMSTVVPQITSQFAAGNNMNQPGAAFAASQGAASALGNIGYNAYNQGLNNQMQALALAPQTNQLPFQNIGAASQAGSALQGQQQSDVNAAVNQWNYGQQLPLQMFNQFANSVQGGYGSTSTLTQPYYSNSGASALGGALGGGILGAGIGSATGLGAGYGAAGGAGLGALAALAMG